MKKDVSEITPLKVQKLSKLRQFQASFYELGRSRRDFFYLLGIGFFQTIGVSMMFTGLTIYCSTVKGLSDVTTGCIAAAYGGFSFLYSILLGGFIDKYGLAYCLIAGNLCALLGFFILLITSNIFLQVTSIFTLFAIAHALILPSLKLGIKHYANEEAKSLGFSLLFIILFGGSAISGIMVDVSLTLGSKDEATFKWIFTIGMVFLGFALIFTFFIENIVENTSDLESWEITREVIKTKTFWKFIVLTFMMVITKSMYSHLIITLPLYMDREIGGDAHFGYMLALHKGVVVFFIPLLTSLVYFFNSYSLLIMGTFISAISVIPLLFASNYVTVVLFIIVISIGESLYAPRLIDYTLAIAPKGKEGTFVALASSPLVLGIIVAGVMGGFLLSGFCPSSGERHCWAMWGVIGMVGLLIPIFMLVFRSWLEEKEQKNEETLGEI